MAAHYGMALQILSQIKPLADPAWLAAAQSCWCWPNLSRSPSIERAPFAWTTRGSCRR